MPILANVYMFTKIMFFNFFAAMGYSIIAFAQFEYIVLIGVTIIAVAVIGVLILILIGICLGNDAK